MHCHRQCTRIHEFIRQLKHYSRNTDIVAVGFLDHKHNALLETKLLQDTLKHHTGKILILYHLELNIDNDSRSYNRLFSILNGNRENYVFHDGIILFIFPKWLLPTIYRKAPDFFSCISFHADFSNLETKMQVPASLASFSYEEFIPLGKKEILLDEIEDYSLSTSERLQSSIKYLILLRQHHIVDKNNTSIIAELLENCKNKPRYINKILDLCIALARYYKAIDEYQLASHYSDIALSLDTLPQAPLEQVKFYIAKTQACMNEEQLDQASQYCKRAKDTVIEADLEETREVIIILNLNGLISVKSGSYEEALERFETALSASVKILGDKHPDTANCLRNIGMTYFYMGDYQDAIEHFKKSKSIWEKVLYHNHPDIATSYSDIGMGYILIGDYPDALANFAKSKSIREKALGGAHPAYAMSLINISMTLLYMGDYKRSIKSFLEAIHVLEKSIGLEQSDMNMALDGLRLAIHAYLDDNGKLEDFETAEIARIKEIQN